ncbi:unnamed protein product [Dibothriocephalus latus]|uniref:Uncharacterized protein n=1 Tax=Dibothriocephalus latus TaxID=60516 RepID=A0A3P7LVJ7_DIBLA|nr:unnamed protein product [Dibothriocephalus latus]
MKVCPDPWPASEHPQLTAPTLVSLTALLAAADPTAGVKEASMEVPAVSDDSYNRLLSVRLPPSPQPSLTSSSSADETTSRVLSSSYAAIATSRNELTQTAEFPFLHAYHDSQSIFLLTSMLMTQNLPA